MLGWILGGVGALAAWEWWRWYTAREVDAGDGDGMPGSTIYSDALEAVIEGRPSSAGARGLGKTVYGPEKFEAGVATGKGATGVKEGERVQVMASLVDGGGYWAVFEGAFAPADATHEARVIVDRVVQERPDEFFAAATSGVLGGLGAPIGETWARLQRPEWGVGDPNVVVGDVVYRSVVARPSEGSDVLVVLEEKNPLGAAKVLVRGRVLEIGENKDGVTVARLGLMKVVATMGPFWGKVYVPKSMTVPAGQLTEEIFVDAPKVAGS